MIMHLFYNGISLERKMGMYSDIKILNATHEVYHNDKFTTNQIDGDLQWMGIFAEQASISWHIILYLLESH